MKDSFFSKIDKWHLEYVGFFVISILLFPIIYLCVRDGNGSAVFQMHDQLDETILNYVFTAKYFGAETYSQMMCGVPAEALKPFCIIFVPLYMVFNVYTAFEIQYAIVIATAFWGMYFCIRKLTDSSVASVIAATLFTCLPVHSVYGNVVMGTPLLIYSILELREKTKSAKIIGIIGIVYYGLSTSMVLSGWVAMLLILMAFIVVSVVEKKVDKNILLSFGILLATYIVCNIDLFIEVFSSNSFVSHREEFTLGSEGAPFIKNFVGILSNGQYVFEAESKHILLIIPIGVALVLVIAVKSARRYLKIFIAAASSILLLAVLYAVLGTSFVCDIKSRLPGMLSSFNVTRVYYFIPGIMYILLGISCAIIIKSIPDKVCLLGYILAALLSMPGLMYIIKDHDGIFYQNVNQINNGQSVTGYHTMKNIYSEELMATIKYDIGEDIDTYRVASIGISPIVSLINGFSTIDGYSNNYNIEYKHEFREIIAGELELNNYIKAYFDDWGNRCYVFYHEWGNAYMLGNGFTGQITDLHLNTEKMKELNCRFIFSAGEICECEQYGMSFIGDYRDDVSYWHIWVYRLD